MAVPPSNSVAPAAYPQYTPENIVKTATGNGWTVTATVKFGAEEYDITWFTPKHLDQQELDTTLKERVNKYYQLHVRFVDDKISKVIWRPDDNTITRYYNDPTQHKFRTKQIGDWTFHSSDPQHESTKNVMGKLADREKDIRNLSTQIVTKKAEIANPQNLPNKPRLDDELADLEKKHKKATLAYNNAEKRLERMQKAQQLSTLYRNSFLAARPPQGQQVPLQNPPAPVSNQGQGNPLPQPQGQHIPLTPQSSQGSPQSAPQSVPKLNTLPLAAPLNAGLNPAPQLQRAILIPDHISVPIDKQSLEQLLQSEQYYRESALQIKEFFSTGELTPGNIVKINEYDQLRKHVRDQITTMREAQRFQNVQHIATASNLFDAWNGRRISARELPESPSNLDWRAVSQQTFDLCSPYYYTLCESSRFQEDVWKLQDELQTDLKREDRLATEDSLAKAKVNLQNAQEAVARFRSDIERTLPSAEALFTKIQASLAPPKESVETVRRKQNTVNTPPNTKLAIQGEPVESGRRPRGPARDAKGSPIEIENIWKTPNTPPVTPQATPPQATPPGRP